MLSPISPEFSRNLGFISEQEQDILHNSTVAIAGAGGDGGMLATQLARLGVGELRLADPEAFELENINRQDWCTKETLGVNKAVAVGAGIESINPEIDVKLYTDGVQEDNVEEFVEGADLLIDETEFTIHAIGVMLARSARAKGIPNLMAMNIGFGATVTAFHPSKGMTFEKMLGLSENSSMEEVASAEPPISSWLPYIPPYADKDMFNAVAKGEKSAPSIAPGVALAASIAATQAMLHLLEGQNKRPSPVYAPRVLVMDSMTGESKNLSLSRKSHYITASRMLIRNMMSRNPQTSY
jgi:molybdopterin/thiamine biosynthesis adenylyltransferase